MKRLTTNVLALATAWCVAGPVCAQAGASVFDTPPPAAAPRPLNIGAASEQRLPNGLRVLVAQRRGLPLVTAQLVLLSGAEQDPEKQAGLASLTNSLLVRGTAKRTASSLAVAAEALGGSLESTAAWDQAQLGITVTTPKLSQALALLSEAARTPAFANDEIDRLKSEVLDAMKVEQAQPGNLAGLAAQRAAFGAGAYGHPINGTLASLPRIKRDDIVAAHQRIYRPDNAVLVFAGDVDSKQAFKLAQQHFATWQPTKTAPKINLAAMPVNGASSWPDGVLVLNMPGAGQAGVAVAMPAPPSHAAQRHIAQVTNAILGDGYSSRLNQEIRIKRGLSYGARSRWDARRQAGLVRVSVQTKNPSAAEVVALIDEQLNSLMTTPVPEPELAARKTSLIGGFGRSVETTRGLAEQVTELAVAGLPQLDLTQRIERLGGVSAADVQAYSASTFKSKQRRVVVAGVAGDFESALKAAGNPVVVVDANGFDLESGKAPQP